MWGDMFDEGDAVPLHSGSLCCRALLHRRLDSSLPSTKHLAYSHWLPCYSHWFSRATSTRDPSRPTTITDPFLSFHNSPNRTAPSSQSPYSVRVNASAWCTDWAVQGRKGDTGMLPMESPLTSSRTQRPPSLPVRRTLVPPPISSGCRIWAPLAT